MKRSILCLFLIVVIFLTTGCAITTKIISKDDFPYNQLGHVWDGGDGYLYTVAKASSNILQLAMNNAEKKARVQILLYFNKKSETLYNTVTIRRSLKGAGPYEVYVLMRMGLASNQHLLQQ